MSSAIRSELTGPVALLTLDRPEKLNALAQADLIAFGAACRALGEDPAVRVVVITGAGRAFSSGADMGDRSAAPDPERFARPVRFMGSRLDFITPLLEIGKPTIAAVNGIAVGAGLGIALACDIRLAGESAAFLANFCQLGIAATDGVPYLLPRAIGASRAFEMLYLGERVEARAALAMGLVSQVHADAELSGKAMAMADRIAAAAPVAMQMTRAATVNGLGQTWSEALVQQELGYLSSVAFGAGDMAEAAAARGEDRPPRFSGSVPYARALPLRDKERPGEADA